MYEEIFRKSFSDEKKKAIAIYGTGVIAKEITLTCNDFNVVGLIDRQLIGGNINGVTIYDIKDIIKMNVDKIVIAAQPQNLEDIYYRIEKFVNLYGITVFDIYGKELPMADWNKANNIFPANSTEEKYAQLMEEIEKHDIISFDIFDTLLMRMVYEPHDIFSLVENQARRRNIYNGNFREERIRAEINLIEKIPTLQELYIEFQKLTGISDYTVSLLKGIEIEVESEMLIPRKKVVELFNYAKEIGKEVYILTDMYLPSELLENILKQNGVEGYKKIFNSCDYHRPKVNGLYNIYVSEVMQQYMDESKSFFHIGDYELADGVCPKQEGIDSWIINKASLLFEKSIFGRLSPLISGINESLLVGMWISKIFNNPFCIAGNRIVITSANDLTWAGVASVFSILIMWLKGKKDTKSKMLMGSRDGWLISKIIGDDSFSYFYTSRRALKKCYSDSKAYTNYKTYLKKMGISTAEVYLFFDLVSSGSCMMYLSELFDLKLKGEFLCHYDRMNPQRCSLIIDSMLDDNVNSNFRKYFLFFEMILTSMEASLIEFDDRGEPVFEDELRSKEELELVGVLQQILVEHNNIYSKYADGVEVDLTLLDGLLGVYNEAIMLHTFSEKTMFCVYDSYGVGRISLY